MIIQMGLETFGLDGKAEVKNGRLKFRKYPYIEVIQCLQMSSHYMNI